MSNPVLTRLREQRSEQEQFIDTLLQRAESEERDLVEAELNNLNACRERIAQIDAQIEPLEEFEEVRSAHRSAAVAAPTGGGASQARGSSLAINDRGHEYRTAGEFVADYVRAVGAEGVLAPDPEALTRVQSAMQTRVVASQSTNENAGLLPVNIIGAVLSDLDGSRPFVQSFGPKDMAGIPGKKFQRPVVTQHTLTAKQSAELAEVTSRQLLISAVDFNKETFGGALNISRQDIDWTSPAAWDAVISDLQFEYGADTDDYAALNFSKGIAQTVDSSAWAMSDIVKALYKGARVASTANDTKRASTRRLVNHVWVSVDQWEVIGAAIDQVRALTAAGSKLPGQSSPMSLGGSILEIERTVVPGFPKGVVVVGNTGMYEFYEERIGLLSAVKPSTFGVEVAYGGYAAAGFLDATGYVKLTGGVTQAWTATTVIAVGTLVRNGAAVLEATVAGTTGGTAPTSPAVGSTVVDGTVTWVRRS